MIVFVLFGCQQWESPTFLGVYSTLAKAEAAAEKLGSSFEFYDIEKEKLDPEE